MSVPISLLPGVGWRFLRHDWMVPEPDDICGPDGDRFACGQIVVGLADGAGEPIETVIERNGGEPATDIIERLDETGAYVIAVKHGTEGDEVSRYRLDESVDYAGLNRAEGEVAE